LERLEASLVHRRYTKGQTVFHMGDEGKSLYIIKKGRIKVTIPSAEGDELILTILSEGQMFGELSFIDGKQRSATVQAMEETEVLCLNREDFLSLLRIRFDLVLKVLELFAQRLRDTDVFLAEAHFLDITSRLAKKLLDLERVFGSKEEGGIRIGVPVTQRDLASMVGATRESINKTLKTFREQGLLEVSKGYIKILDPPGLARKAQMEDWLAI